MPISKKTNLGTIRVQDVAIATLAGTAISECYGIVGVTSRSYVKDSFNDLLKKENYSKGVLTTNRNNEITIDVYVILSYGVKISEVVYEAQKRVKYNVEKSLNMDVKEVNVHVEGVKIVS